MLELIGDSASNKRAGCSASPHSTVEFHVRALSKKLRARNRIETALLALRRGPV